MAKKKQARPDEMQQYEDMLENKGCPECKSGDTYEAKATVNGKDGVTVCICDECGELLEKPSLYRLFYNIEPRFEAKLLKIFDKFNLEWTHAGWIDGEKEGSLIGSKEQLIRFQQGGSRISRKDAEAMITKVEVEYRSGATVFCKFCEEEVPESLAHRHGNSWVCEGCRDKRRQNGDE